MNRAIMKLWGNYTITKKSNKIYKPLKPFTSEILFSQFVSNFTKWELE
ncbi:hypothetical protein SAMN05421856_103415 [Chryseobacterium taichungense]|uniref:Uncharacterized protein n=1 Tax=Chryseobacterium taichungense TaxID=295069 RepID=A0A1H7YLX2_9FLAO|nr:hypothetical protein SAMN05421856_103415 [Chryseobacterium taichungense]